MTDSGSESYWEKFGGTLTQPIKPMEFDGIRSRTSDDQEDVEALISDLLIPYRSISSDDGTETLLPPAKNIAKLQIDAHPHLKYLSKLLDTLPSFFTGLDASRPWIIYWCINSLSLMNITLDIASRQRAARTVLSFQSEDGGFGGGIGQMAHLAPTYSSIMALAIIGDDESWELIDRRKLLKWLLSLKQPDGSFIMHHGGEVDVRGVYCALCVATLLNILTPSLVAGVEDFVISCQTYEGGLAASSYPVSPTFSVPIGEAHGGYTFCALASYHILHSLTFLPKPSRTLDLENLYRWAASMQGLPIEAGGFRGRTNKLVDGCYGWWCGGLFPILKAERERKKRDEKVVNGGTTNGINGKVHVDQDVWEDVPEDEIYGLGYDRVAAQEYVLLIAQVKSGGFRDKPGKSVDAYHTSSNLSGLSSSQHKMIWSPSLASQLEEIFKDPYDRDLEGTFPVMNGHQQGTSHLIKDDKETEKEASERMKENFIRALSWTEDERGRLVVGHAENELVLGHPIFNVTIESAKKIMSHFYRQPLERFSNLKGDLL